MLYLSLLYLVILYCIDIDKKYKKYLALIPFIVVALIRYGIGADFFSYKYIYNIINGKSFAYAQDLLPDIDKAFLFIFHFLGKIGLSYQASITLFVLVLITVVSIWIYKNSENEVLSFLIYLSSFFLVWHLSAIRQGIALTLGAVILFRKKELPAWLEIILIIPLFFFHSSVLFLLPFVLVKRINFKKRHFLYMLILSLIVSLLPLEIIFSYFDFIPRVHKFLSYISDSNSLLSFSSISRLVLFAVVYIHYDDLTKETYYKKLTNVYLFGFVVYFSISFAGVAAGRFFSYTFITSIILYPKIVELYEGRKRKIVGLVVLGYVSMFTVKEINTIKYQTGIKTDSKFMPSTTIFNKDKYSYNSYFYNFTKQMDHFALSVNEFYKEAPEIMKNVVEADETMSFVSLYRGSVKKHYIMNQNGELVIPPMFKNKPVIYSHYLRIPINENESEYFDIISKSYIEDVSLQKEIDENTQEEAKNTYVTRRVYFGDLSDDLKAHIEFPDSLGEIHEFTYTAKNHHYKVLKLTYFAKHVYIYMDMDGNPLLETYYQRFTDMDQNGFFQGVATNAVILYYFDGTKIWETKN